MRDPSDDDTDPQLQLLRALAGANAAIAGDVIEVSHDVWAVHGVIPVDGDEILAEFGSYDEARLFLDQVPPGSHVTPRP